MASADLYQSVLQKLSKLPVSYLENVDRYLSELGEQAKSENATVDSIMSFAGGWNDMEESDFQDFVKDMEEGRKTLFNRVSES
ncbi:MAG: hypothetical protein AAF798_10905 [Bacteroidota bacterium]